MAVDLILLCLYLLAQWLFIMNAAQHQARWRIVSLATQAAKHRPKLTLTQKGSAFCALTLGVGFVALNSGNNLIYLVLGMMLSLILSSGVLSSINLHRVRVRRNQELKGYAGKKILVELNLSNLKTRWPSMGIGLEDPPVYDQQMNNQSLFSSNRQSQQVEIAKQDQQSMYILRLKGGESESVRYQICIERRGEYILEGARIYTRFPFGFFEKSIGLRLQQSLLVAPRVDARLSAKLEHELQYLSARLLDFKEVKNQAQEESKQQDDPRLSSNYSDDYAASLDVYQIGMPLKWVHWKSSAKRGELLIRQVLPEPKNSYTLWINPFYDHQKTAPTELEQDAYANLIMSVCDRLWHAGYTLKLYGFKNDDLSWNKYVDLIFDSEDSQAFVKDLINYQTRPIHHSIVPPSGPCLKLSMTQGLSLIAKHYRSEIFEPLESRDEKEEDQSSKTQNQIDQSQRA